MLLVSDKMRERLHVELDLALNNIDKKLDSAGGKMPGEVELEVTYRRDLKEGGPAYENQLYVMYFYTAEVSQAGITESGCDGQSLHIFGEKFDI